MTHWTIEQVAAKVAALAGEHEKFVAAFSALTLEEIFQQTTGRPLEQCTPEDAARFTDFVEDLGRVKDQQTTRFIAAGVAIHAAIAEQDRCSCPIRFGTATDVVDAATRARVAHRTGCRR